jgi:hypothetical protein
MDQQIYQKFINLEHDHWWFQGRRKVYMGLLDAYLKKEGIDIIGQKALDLGAG